MEIVAFIIMMIVPVLAIVSLVMAVIIRTRLKKLEPLILNSYKRIQAAELLSLSGGSMSAEQVERYVMDISETV